MVMSNKRHIRAQGFDPTADTFAECRGEYKLVVAILLQGVLDAKKGDPGARYWLKTPHFARWCELIDLDPCWLRKGLGIFE
jgi:hypothetical protein